MAEKIDGKKIANYIYAQIKGDLKILSNNPGLAVILVGQNKASKIYVALKEKKAKELKINFFKFIFKSTALKLEIIKKINELNKNPNINGILIQTPLPKHLNISKIVKHISFLKDIDGFLKKSPVTSPLILAIIECLKNINIDLIKRKAALLVNSKIFGNLLKKTLEKEFKISCKIFLPQKENWHYIKTTDIIICARGNPHFLKSIYIKKGTVLIDVGITRVGKKVLGDIAPQAQKKASFYTPVPGGIGPLTVAFLFKNLLILTKQQCIKNVSTSDVNT